MTMQKIWDLIREMTLEEKIGMIHGQGIFHTKGVERLGIPPLWMSDGPMGVRKELQDDNWAPKGTTDDYVSYLPAIRPSPAPGTGSGRQTWDACWGRRPGDVERT